jgi:hypothetical protein
MRLALHVILRLDQEDCILGRGLTPVLQHFNLIKLVIVITNALDFAIAAILL